MKQAAFVDLVRRLVVEPAASDTITQIARPVGRGVSAERASRATWINSLSAEGRSHLEYAVAEAAHAAAFGLLCVLDGNRVIEDGPSRGHLELRYVDGQSATLLASSDMQALPLHELL